MLNNPTNNNMYLPPGKYSLNRLIVKWTSFYNLKFLPWNSIPDPGQVAVWTCISAIIEVDNAGGKIMANNKKTFMICEYVYDCDKICSRIYIIAVYIR